MEEKLFSPLVCSTVRVGCCAGAEAMPTKKNQYRLYCNSSYLEIEYTVIASVIFVTSLHLLYCPLVQTRTTGL